MNEPGVLNPAAIERLGKLGGDKFVSEMIDLFVSYGGKKIAETRLAQQAGNLPGVADAAHAIKSSAGNIGAVRVQESAMLIERFARDAKIDAVTLQIDELERAFAEVTTLLETQTARFKSKPA